MPSSSIAYYFASTTTAVIPGAGLATVPASVPTAAMDFQITVIAVITNSDDVVTVEVVATVEVAVVAAMVMAMAVVGRLFAIAVRFLLIGC